MSSAVASVTQRIIVEGEDRASASINSAQGSMRSMAATAQSTTQKAGGAFAAMASAIGPAGSQIAEIGKSATALGSTANILPGPIGLATAAVVGLAVGAKMLVDYISQANAQERLLITGAGQSMAGKFKLDREAAVSLSKSLATLSSDGLRPSDELIKRVVDNAKALGGKPEEAVAKFIAAWKEGPDALAKVQQELGAIGVSMENLAETANRFGFDAQALGFKPLLLGADALKAKIGELAKAELEAQVARQSGDKDRIAAAQEIADKTKKEADAIRNGLTASVQVAAIQRDRQRDLADFDGRASTARTKELAHGLKLQGIMIARTSIDAQLLAIKAAQVALGDTEANRQADALNAEKATLDLREKQELAASRAEQKAKSKENAAKALANLEAEISAQGRLRKAQADVITDYASGTAIKLRVLAADELADLKAADRAKTTAKAKNLNIAAIEREASNKRRDLLAEESRASEANVISLDAARSRRDAAQAQTRIAVLRNAGDEEAAIAAESAEAQRQYGEEVAAILKDVADRRRAGSIAASDEARVAEEVAARKVEAEQRVLSAQRDAADKRDAIRKRELNGAISTFQRAASVAQGPVAEGMKSAADQVQRLTDGWKDSKNHAGDAISAGGQVAAAFVSDTQTKAAIMAVFEGASAIASFASQDYVGGAGHAAAAVMYGAVAGGLVGTTTASNSGGGQGGASSATTQAGGGNAPQESGKGSVVHVHFDRGFAIGTKHEIGKAVVSAVKSLKGTGYAA